MWDLIEYGGALIALVLFVNILFHKPIHITEEWDNKESDKKDEK